MDNVMQPETGLSTMPPSFPCCTVYNVTIHMPDNCYVDGIRRNCCYSQKSGTNSLNTQWRS